MIGVSTSEAFTMSPTISLRPITEDDLPFLHHVYASTREDELSAVDWSTEQKEAFLRQQFSAQHQHYQQHYKGSDFSLVVVDGEPVGRLYVARWSKEIRIVDIALLPAHRGRGLGGSLLRALLAEGAAAGKPVTIHVEMFNPALHLYERLGFERAGELGVYHFMRWTPPAAP